VILLTRVLVGLVCCTAALACATLGGCNIAQAVETLTRPDPVVEAKYVLRAEPTVVMFDDHYSIVTPVRLRRDIADEATVVLMECGDMADMISPVDAMRLASKKDREGRVSISDIGTGVGAGQVIYIEPVRFSVPRITGVAEPTALYRVKVIDSATRKRVWPDDEKGGVAGWPVNVVLSRDEAMNLAAKSHSAIARELARRSGDEIARLFCDTKYSQHGNRLLGQ
jgi:hypothetical protein